MKFYALVGALALSASALADTAATTYDVKGMHCGACAQLIESKVCKMEGVKTCKVELTNPKKEMGKVTMTMEDGKQPDAVAIQKMLAEAGDYYIVRSPKK